MSATFSTPSTTTSVVSASSISSKSDQKEKTKATTNSTISEGEEKLSHILVNTLRESITKSIKEVGKDIHDPWDEKSCGVAWFDNELGFLDQLRDQPKLGHCIVSEYDKCQTVEECRQIALARGTEYLRQAICFTSLGGTGITGIFELRETRDPVKIGDFLSRLNDSLTSVIDLLHT
jgi:hypothetical protein